MRGSTVYHHEAYTLAACNNVRLVLLITLGAVNVQLTFSSCHKFSIGLASGLSGGVIHQLIPLLSKKSLALREVCLGSLSCIKRWPSAYTCPK